MSQITIYTCDRCGSESSEHMSDYSWARWNADGIHADLCYECADYIGRWVFAEMTGRREVKDAEAVAG